MQATCKRAFIIGLDGLRGAAVAETATPSLDAVFADGVRTLRAQTVMPSSSYQAWGSMFHGVGPDKHQIGGSTPIAEDVAWPSFMKIARRQHPAATLGAYCCWTPIIRDIIEESADCQTLSTGDAELTAAACEFIRTQKPGLFFLHLDEIDGAGHSHGYRSDEYLAQITVTDGLVGDVIAAIRDIGAYDDSLILILSDHGGVTFDLPDGGVAHSHGREDDDCMEILWGARGPGIAKGVELDGEVNIMDTAAVVARALGLSVPAGWDAKVPVGVFV